MLTIMVGQKILQTHLKTDLLVVAGVILLMVVPKKLTIVWHASFNSRGTFISASTPDEVSESLNRAIGNVGNRLGSAASVAFSTTSLSSDTDVFLAQFNKQGNKWSGDLFSLELDDEWHICNSR